MPFMQRLSRCVMPAAFLLTTALLAPPAFADTNPTNSAGTSPGLQGSWSGKDFDDLDGAELNAAKQAALSAHFSTLRVCADPGNMPLSDRAGEGYENRILDVLAKAMGARLSYYWRSYDGDIVGQAFGTADECDILMDMPDHDQDFLSSVPIYRTTYVFVSRTNENLSIKGLDDARLKQLRVGVFEISALREALSNHGVVANVQALAGGQRHGMGSGASALAAGRAGGRRQAGYRRRVGPHGGLAEEHERRSDHPPAHQSHGR